VNSEDRIEQMRKPDAVCLGDEPEQLSVAVEAPWLALFCHLKARFISAVQDLVAHTSGRILVRQFQSAVAVPLNIDDRDECLGKDPTHSDIGLKIFKLHELDLLIVWERESKLRNGGELGPSAVEPTPRSASKAVGRQECFAGLRGMPS